MWGPLWSSYDPDVIIMEKENTHQKAAGLDNHCSRPSVFSSAQLPWHVQPSYITLSKGNKFCKSPRNSSVYPRQPAAKAAVKTC